MNEISKYIILDTLYESHRSVIYRAQDRDTDRRCILKQLNITYPSAEQLARFRLEYAFASELDVEGVVSARNLFRVGNSLAFVMDDEGGVSLDNWPAVYEMPIVDLLKIFIQLATILEQIHHRHIIHKDINPSNILIIPTTKKIALIDFGIASKLPKEQTITQNPGILEGTLPFMSPEQTGRMNRALDYRSDFYSLGATFYALLTGQPPFSSEDPLAIVHAHIAVQPKPPETLRDSIPTQLSAIVLKLLSKTAEDRYQSMFGLRADLQACLDQLEEKGRVDAFPLGTHDLSEGFQISQKLYGRDWEIEKLLGAFDRVSQGASELMLVTGAPGIGKSALINEIHKPIVRQRGYFIRGKFDQLQRNIPYSAVIQAFQNLIKQILTEPAERIEQWRQELLEALGPNGQVLIDVIPEVSLIIGEQPPIPPLGIIESQNRLNLVFRRFIGVFARADHPVAMFLDDLQWADSGTLGMLQLLISDAGSRHLFLIGAYRDNEVNDAHPLALTLEALSDSRNRISTISLAPLALEHITALATDSLNDSPDAIMELAVHILRKTEGNPFFINQFLMSLDEEGLLSFDRSSKAWRYRIEDIEKMNFTDNVVDLTTNKIQRLPRETQTALQLVACIGNQFDLPTLARVREQSLAATAAELWPAIEEGLVNPIGDNYRFFQGDGAAAEDQEFDMFAADTMVVSYQFLHDRVQQAAYSLISDVDKEAVHLNIGRLRLPELENGSGSELLFDVIHHLNIGRRYIEDEAERSRLAELNLNAGRRAKESSAFQPALAYLETGIQLLSPDCWVDQYELALALHVEAAEASYLNTQFDQTEKYAGIVFDHATALLDKVKIHEVRIQSFMAQHKMPEAVEEAIRVLKLLDVSLPSNPGTLHILQGFISTKMALRGKSIEDLNNLPELEDPRKLAAMRILMEAAAPVYFAAPKLFPLLVFSMIKLSVKYGNAPISAFAYTMYGVLLCGAFGDIPGGYEIGQFGVALYDRFQSIALKAKVYMVFYNSVKIWKDHIRESLPYLLEGYQSGLETGDLEYAAIISMTYCNYAFLAGKELEPLEKEMASFADAISKMKQEGHLQNIQIYWQTVLNLLGRNTDATELSGAAYEAEERIPRLIEANDNPTLCRVYLNRLLLNYLFGNYEAAVEEANNADKISENLLGTAYLPMFHFYAALAHLKHLENQNAAGRKKTWKKINSHRKKIGNWAKHAPSNCLHKLQLINAEIARFQGKKIEASDLYDEAISGARNNGFLQEEALAGELAGRFYQAVGRPKVAQVYMLDARHAYLRWGATAKVAHMDVVYENLLSISGNIQMGGQDTLLTVAYGADRSGELDLTTVLKASQAISGEIIIEKLLARLMRIVLENAGATRGFLIREKAGQYVIEAEASFDRENVTVSQSIAIADSDRLSAAVVNYVGRTKENVVISDASKDKLFGQDTYIVRKAPKSILCVPLINQGSLTAIVYLENNLTVGAFTPDRIDVLRMLSSEMAISIENASLYKNLEKANEQLELYNQTLEHKVKERTEELARSLEELKTAQNQLIQSEKLASLGQLAAGIAHEIKNPLNFINNFARLNTELTEDLKDFLTQERSVSEVVHEEGNTSAGTTEATPLLAPSLGDALELLDMLQMNAAKIHEHGERADDIVSSMLMHARDISDDQIEINLNPFLEEFVSLAYHGNKSHAVSLEVDIQRHYDESIGKLMLVPQGVSRVFVNLLNNAFDALREKKTADPDFKPILKIITRNRDKTFEILVEDNGPGIPESNQKKIFEPFFSTKPTGKGTGLGLSLSYDIVVQGMGGRLEVESKEGEYAIFKVTLPRILPEEGAAEG